MKTKLFSTIIRSVMVALCMTLFVPQLSRAEKIQYGKYITYDGKVDSNGKPFGKGKLELAYKVQGVAGLETNKDVIEGVFDGEKVSGAKLALARYNGPLWINSAKFKGTLEYSIAGDGSSITYTLIDGKFESKNLISIVINGDLPFTIKRIPQTEGCKTEAGKLYQNKNLPNSSLGDFQIPSNPLIASSDLGKIKTVKAYVSYVLEEDFSAKPTNGDGTEITADYENGYTYSFFDKGFSLRYPNKDFFSLSSASSGNVATFQKTFPEGLLSYSGGDYCVLQGNDGKRKGYFRKEFNNEQDLIDLMKANTLQDAGGTLYEGHIAELIEKASSDDAQAQYDLGIAFLDGIGVKKDENTGKKWLSQASEKGNEKAIARMKAEEAKELEAQYAKAAAQMKAKNAIDVAYMKLEIVKDLSNLAMSNNLTTELKKLAGGGDYINGNFRLKVPICGFQFQGNTTAVNPAKNSITIELIDFGNQGKTALTTLDIPDLDRSETFAASGRNVKIGQGQGMLITMIGNKPIGALGRADGKWVYILSTLDGVLMDFQRGMSISEVEATTKKLELSSFKQTGKTAKYTIYSVFWLDMKKQYNSLGTDYQYQMRNDKKYGDFYFDTKGRLMKWIMFL